MLPLREENTLAFVLPTIHLNTQNSVFATNFSFIVIKYMSS
jgi:hypothetical protein